MDGEETDETVVREGTILYVIEYGEGESYVPRQLTVNVFDVTDVADDCYPQDTWLSQT